MSEKAPVKRPVSELRKGDVIEFEDEPAELLAEPFVGYRGLAMFDRFELFLRAPVRSIALGERRIATWSTDEQVRVIPNG